MDFLRTSFWGFQELLVLLWNPDSFVVAFVLELAGVRLFSEVGKCCPTVFHVDVTG